MYEQVEKPKENKSRAVANFVTQKKSDVKQGFGFVDNRPEAIIQRKLQVIANNYTERYHKPFRNESINFSKYSNAVGELIKQNGFNVNTEDILIGTDNVKNTNCHQSEGENNAIQSFLDNRMDKEGQVTPQLFNSVPSNFVTQRMRIQITPSLNIETGDYKKTELQDIAVKLRFDDHGYSANLLEQAIQRGEYSEEADIPLSDLMNAGEDDSLFAEDDDPDFPEYVAESGNYRFFQGGLDFTQEYFEKKSKPLNLNKSQGEMLELAFDQLMDEEEISSRNTNDFQSNCPGFDHITNFGGRFFEQSKCYNSGSLDEITSHYEDTSKRLGGMSTLFLNKSISDKKVGQNLRGMFEDEDVLGMDKDDFLKDMGDTIEEKFQYNQDDEEPEFFEFYEEDKSVEAMKDKSFMQVPEDVFMNLHQRGNDMDLFMSNDLTTKQITEFQDFVVDKGWAKRPKEYRRSSVDEDYEFDENEIDEDEFDEDF